MIVEALALISKIDLLVKTDRPNIPKDKPFEVDSVVHLANKVFVEHNVSRQQIDSKIVSFTLVEGKK